MSNLVGGLFGHAMASPERLALSVAGHETTYGALVRLGQRIGGWAQGAKTVGVLAGRSLAGYAGVVGACWSGATYVPLGVTWPEARLRAALDVLALDALICDAAGEKLLPDLPIKRLRPEDISGLPERPDFAPVERADQDIAYVIFTSGTTGTPKAVAMGFAAITHHLAVIQEAYGFTAEDRISMVPELTFDPSILNMFMTWNAGASLHVPQPAQLLTAPSFINAQRLTVWNSAPTLIGMLTRLGWLPAGALPGLRISIFGGDILTLTAASIWAKAAPHSVVDNVYGPAEAAIEVLHQRLTEPPVVTQARASLAIGRPYRGTEAAIFDGMRRPCPPSEAGELALAGPQLAAGYLGQPELTATRFPVIAGKRWYFTGDKAYQDEAGVFHHLGRCDEQTKVRGQRVELGDVESHLRAVSGAAQVAAVAWPYADGAATGLVAFVVPPAPAERQMLAALKRLLPAFMMPQFIMLLAAMPLTPHGKIDRAALIRRLEGQDEVV